MYNKEIAQLSDALSELITAIVRDATLQATGTQSKVETQEATAPPPPPKLVDNWLTQTRALAKDLAVKNKELLTDARKVLANMEYQTLGECFTKGSAEEQKAVTKRFNELLTE